MQIGNIRELAAAVRAERRKLGLSQSALADKAGVGRDWIIGLEKAKATVEIGLVLRTLKSLGLTIHLGSTSEAHPPGGINLNELLADHLEKQ